MLLHHLCEFFVFFLLLLEILVSSSILSRRMEERELAERGRDRENFVPMTSQQHADSG